MIINFTNNYQFQTRLQLNKQNIEVVDQIIFLGTEAEAEEEGDECYSQNSFWYW